MHSSRLAAIFILLLVPSVHAQEFEFSWDQATTYRIVTDRFSNGDSSNDFAYGRGLDGNGNSYETDSTGHFLGGDFAGITGWIEDGYFADLGINVLRLSAPYEQVHGWVGGGDGDFQQYAYDGMWPLDFTESDRAFGSKADFQLLVDTAHAHGMRVVVDVNLSYVGPATMHDMAAFGFGGLTSDGWRSWTPSSRVGWQSYQREYVTYTDSLDSWSRWWGSEWVKAGIAGYESCASEEGSTCNDILPALRSDVDVSQIPHFLQLKWGEEKASAQAVELESFFDRTGARRSAANHVVKWMTDWVGEFGIDGFHLSEADQVDPSVSSFLKQEATAALARWKSANPQKSLDDREFWMTGSSSVTDSQSSLYGFDAVHRQVKSVAADNEMSTYFEDLVARAGEEATSYVTHLSADDASLFDRMSLQDAGTKFLLAPGAVSIFYGDESARRPGSDVSDPSHAANSFMNWADADEEILSHWQKIGAFRAAHPAVATGGYDMVQESPYAFHRGMRQGADTDQVVIVLGAEGKTRVKVSIVWPDDTILRDAYTGNVSIVSFGQVTFDAAPSGLMLLEEMPME